MAERVCETCGTANSGTSSFCTVCDTFLGWHDEVDEAEAAPPGGDQTPGTDGPGGPGAGSGGPGPGGPGPGGPGPGGAGPGGAGSGPQPGHPPRDRVRPPVVSLDAGDVVVTATESGTFELSIKNDSTIVDSYTIHPATPPPWLVVTHGDTNLLPDQVRTVQVTLAVRPRALALAQRTTVPLLVRSSVDPEQRVEVPVTVVIPKDGPPAAVVARPTLIRLQDRGQGSLELRFDNQASNHPRRYRLSGSDPESVVMFDFLPPAVDVPAGGTAEAVVRFAAPEPPPGADVARQLTLTGTDDEGPVSLQVTVAQSTTAPPERRPVKMRLEPSQLTAIDASSAPVNLVIDNRTGTEVVKVNLRGRDPAGAVGFTFAHTRVGVNPGQEGWVRIEVSANPPPPGQSVTRPFSIVATDDDNQEVEASGAIELTSRPSAIVSAQLRVFPEHLAVTSKKGTFAVDVDNRSGLEPLYVHLSGADEFGRASLRFTPADVTVAAGQLSRATLVVSHPRPAGGSSTSRRIQVVATSGVQAIEAEAVFTQRAESYRRLWGILATLLGALLVLVGIVLFTDTVDRQSVEDAVRSLVANAEDGTTPEEGPIRTAAAAAALVLCFLFAVMIAFGSTSRTGRAARAGAVVAVLMGIVVAVATTVAGAGLIVVLVGAVVAFTGGILLRSGA